MHAYISNTRGGCDVKWNLIQQDTDKYVVWVCVKIFNGIIIINYKPYFLY